MCLRKTRQRIFLSVILVVLSGCSSVNPQKENEIAYTVESTSLSTESSVEIPEEEISEEVPEETVPEETVLEEAVSEDDIFKEALALIEEKNYPLAIGKLSSIEGNADAEFLLEQLRYIVSGDYIANLLCSVAAIDTEGNVIICASEEEYEEHNYEVVQNWTGIKRLSNPLGGLDAVNKEGKCYTTLSSEKAGERNERLCALDEIELFSTDNDCYAALDKQGNLHAFTQFGDYLELEAVQEEIRNWDNIVDVVGGKERVAVLHKDGTVSFIYRYKLPGKDYVVPLPYSTIYDDMEQWTDIVSISGSSGGNIVGLKSDGTVVVSRHRMGLGFGYDFTATSKWTDIISISMSGGNILGLKKDGTVVVTGVTNEKQKEVETWTDIAAIAAGQIFHVGLKADGTLVIAGESDRIVMPDVSQVKNLLVPTVEYPCSN